MAEGTPATTPPPELTVVVPCWNAAETIERALATVLADPGDSLEVLAVDDASTDATVEVLERLAARDPRVVVIRSPVNGGASAARNLALERMRGAWVTFVDADDILTDGAIAALMRPTRTTDALAVVGQRIWSDGERQWRTSLYGIPDIREPGPKSLATAPGLVYYASATGKAFHHSLIGDLRFEGRVFGDQPWTLRALLRAGERIEVIADDVYVWLRPPTEVTDPRSITATSRSTVRGSVAAIGVATGSYAEVCAEARRTVDEPAGQRLIAKVYLERLLRADFAMYLRRALDRRDHAVGELIDANDRFLASLPRDLLAEDGSLVARTLLKPVVGAWSWLPPNARDAFWTTVRRAVAADPRVAGQLGGGRMARAAIRLVAAFDSRPTRWLATRAMDRAAAARARATARTTTATADPLIPADDAVPPPASPQGQGGPPPR